MVFAMPRPRHPHNHGLVRAVAPSSQHQKIVTRLGKLKPNVAVLPDLISVPMNSKTRKYKRKDIGGRSHHDARITSKGRRPKGRMGWNIQPWTNEYNTRRRTRQHEQEENNQNITRSLSRFLPEASQSVGRGPRHDTRQFHHSSTTRGQNLFLFLIPSLFRVSALSSQFLTLRTDNAITKNNARGEAERLVERERKKETEGRGTDTHRRPTPTLAD